MANQSQVIWQMPGCNLPGVTWPAFKIKCARIGLLPTYSQPSVCTRARVCVCVRVHAYVRECACTLKRFFWALLLVWVTITNVEKPATKAIRALGSGCLVVAAGT